MEKVDVIVVGAGVVGLAIARELALERGREVLILEQHESFGSETSSRNSEVIHAGIYYRPGSLKAKTCVEGNKLLYQYCAARAIAHKRTTKLIVATEPDEVAKLESIRANSRSNGCETLRWMTGTEVRQLEPEITCRAALFSPATGVVDSHSFMLSLLGDAEAAGSTAVFCTEVTGGEIDSSSPVKIEAQSGGETTQLDANCVINAAGLHALSLAGRIRGINLNNLPKMQFSKGNYFGITGRPKISRLIYPVPVTGGLGVHLTLDLAGRVRFGPDNEQVSEIDYRVNPGRATEFYRSIRRFWPGLEDGSLTPDYSGIRPQLSIAGGNFRDFLVTSAGSRGQLINLFAIESPGLTAALSLAKHVARMVPR
mmetsp:Transcript_22078/g.89527  ORF Transcript_22078/g.89527 Transcript_22078/m.89527 type:complete len:369 (-) Transcript_22078:661-1767(-)